MKKPAVPVPNQFLNFFSSRVPDIWKKGDYFQHDQNAAGETWATQVFMPSSAWEEVLQETRPLMSQEAFATLKSNMQVLGAWRPTQDIMRFDEDFYGILTKTSLTGNLPAEIFQRMPAWVLYFGWCQ